MKKLRIMLAVILAFLCSAFMFAGCWDEDEGSSTTSQIIVGEQQYTVQAEQFEFLGDALDSLVESDGLFLEVNGEKNSLYGRSVSKIGTLNPSTGDGEFIGFYVSSTDPKLADLLITKEIGGVSYNLGAKGIDQMPLRAGVVYIFIVDVYVP